jgi:hypothetical protein
MSTSARQRARQRKRELSRRRLSESVTDSVSGAPISFEALNSYRGTPLVPLFFRDYYQSKPTTVRTVQQMDRVRQLARYAYETNENAQAVINGMCAYVVSGGYDVRVSPKERFENKVPDEVVEAAQSLLDEFVEVNELKDASDGCPMYDEAFVRAHVEGECFLRFYFDENDLTDEPFVDVTRVRFVEPDNVRPPKGSNWEGPWSWGVLTSGSDRDGSYSGNLAEDTQTPRAYNLNYPLVDKDETVKAADVAHLKLNVKKNQKRGLSSFYCVDETLRGTQKLRYAAREGAKIRASIPYVREHAQADQATVQALQEGVVTSTVERSAEMGQQYTVPVQQIEPGSVPDIPQSLVMRPAPSDPNAEGVEQNLRHGVETIAARFNCPPWLVGGTTGDSSYADGLVKESPFYKTLVKQQKKQTGFWGGVFYVVLEIAEEQGRLPQGTSEALAVMVTAEDPQVRNEAERLASNLQLYQAGGVSLHTIVAEAGHDLDEERAHLKQEAAEGLVPGGDEEGADDSGKTEPKTVSGRRQRDMKEAFSEVALASAVHTAVRLSEAKNSQDDPHVKRLQNIMYDAFPENTWHQGQCANLAFGVQKHLAARGIDAIVEMNRDGTHVRSRVGERAIQGGRTPGYYYDDDYAPATAEDVQKANIRVTPRRIDDVARTLDRLTKFSESKDPPVSAYEAAHAHVRKSTLWAWSRKEPGHVYTAPALDDEDAYNDHFSAFGPPEMFDAGGRHHSTKNALYGVMTKNGREYSGDEKTLTKLHDALEKTFPGHRVVAPFELWKNVPGPKKKRPSPGSAERLPMEEATQYTAVDQAHAFIDAKARRDTSWDSGYGVDCHEYSAALADRPEGVDEHFAWDDDKADEKLNALKALRPQLNKKEAAFADEMLSGEVNGHSFVRIGDKYVDPGLRTRGWHDDEIQSIDGKLARAWRVQYEEATRTSRTTGSLWMWDGNALHTAPAKAGGKAADNHDAAFDMTDSQAWGRHHDASNQLYAVVPGKTRPTIVDSVSRMPEGLHAELGAQFPGYRLADPYTVWDADKKTAGNQPARGSSFRYGESALWNPPAKQPEPGTSVRLPTEEQQHVLFQ